MGKFLFFIFAIFGLVLFFSPEKALAIEPVEPPKVVINELMWMGSSKSTADEWIELRNMSSNPIDFLDTPWSIYKNDNLMLVINKGILGPGGYFLVSNYGSTSTVLGIKADLVDTAVSLLNSDVQYKLYDFIDDSGNLMDVVDDGVGVPLAGEYTAGSKWASMERNFVPGDGTKVSNWFTAFNSIGFADGMIEQGTPRIENSSLVSDPPDPDPVTPMASTDLKTEINKNTVTFTWENADTQKLDFEIIVTDKDGAAVIDHEPPQDLTKMEYKTTLDWGSYTWQIIAKNSAGKEISVDGSEFELVQPVYSKNIIVNEVLPHPSVTADNEFIELYNSGAEDVDLEGWFLDDIASGGSTPYEIPAEKIISAGGYLVFYKTETKLSLNDTGDSARLLFPDGNMASACSFSAASIDLVWARDKDLKWSWTEKITPGLVNNIYLTPEKDDPAVNTDEEEVVINSVPISIKSGDYRDYSNKLVKLTGTIISTSGNTFYLDDGSGQAKIYIQDKTGIKKPPMHKGDIFEIFGIVNLYRNSWRVLPQKQTDVKLIKCIKDVKQVSNPVNKSSTSSATKTSATVVKTAQARAPDSILPIIKEVKAAEISPVSDTKDSPKNSLGSFAKVLIGLGVIFLILLVIKVRSFKSIRVIGGHFGEDDT